MNNEIFMHCGFVHIGLVIDFIPSSLGKPAIAAIFDFNPLK